uniref:G domain-containing protein n=1 Tax=Panagrellus redivivus TaxID=6233 RepID=A0A7E4VNU0_PANRE
MKSLYARRRSLGTTLMHPMDTDEEVKANDRGRRTSTALPRRRSSIAQLLFGNNNNNSDKSPDTLTVPSQSQASLLSSGSVSSRLNRRRSRPSISVPYDSRSEFTFNTSSNSASEDEAFVDDDLIGQQQSLAESVEQFLAQRQRKLESPKPGKKFKSKLRSRGVSQTNLAMRKVMHIVVAGGRKSGKTALLQQLACFRDITNESYAPTIDDTYQIQTGTNGINGVSNSGDGPGAPKETLIFHDTAGLGDYGAAEVKRPYLQVADAFILVFSVQDPDSFNRMDALRKFIDKHYSKDKKDMALVVVATMTDLPGRKVDAEFVSTWASKERVKVFEATATNRATLLDIVHYLAGRHFHPIKESKFSLTKKLRPEKSNAASHQQTILTDI